MVGLRIETKGMVGTIIAECWIPRTSGGYYVCRCTGYIVKFDDCSVGVIEPEEIEKILNR